MENQFMCRSGEGKMIRQKEVEENFPSDTKVFYLDAEKDYLEAVQALQKDKKSISIFPKYIR